MAEAEGEGPSHLNPQMEDAVMLSWSLLFLIVALIAGFLGFGVLAGAAAGIAKLLFFLFIVLLVVAAIATAVRRRPPSA
jgi:uncharacterized membrane protein YtjA (UPF0391 family)